MMKKCTKNEIGSATCWKQEIEPEIIGKEECFWEEKVTRANLPVFLDILIKSSVAMTFTRVIADKLFFFVCQKFI